MTATKYDHFVIHVNIFTFHSGYNVVIHVSHSTEQFLKPDLRLFQFIFPDMHSNVSENLLVFEIQSQLCGTNFKCLGDDLKKLCCFIPGLDRRLL